MRISRYNQQKDLNRERYVLLRRKVEFMTIVEMKSLTEFFANAHEKNQLIIEVEDILKVLIPLYEVSLLRQILIPAAGNCSSCLSAGGISEVSIFLN